MGFYIFCYIFIFFISTLPGLTWSWMNGLVLGLCPYDHSPLAYGYSCKNYYDCSTGNPELRECPFGLVWNCMTQTCEKTTYDFCCRSQDLSLLMVKDGINYPCKPGAIAPDFRYTAYFRVCVNGTKLISGYCDEGGAYCSAALDCYFNKTESCTTEIYHLTPEIPYKTIDGVFVADAPWTVCPIDLANFNDQLDCKSYYNCSTGVPQLWECPNGYVYDCMNDACSTNVYMFCCQFDTHTPDKVKKDTFHYRCKNNTIIKDPEYSDSFYLCKDDRIYSGECNNFNFCNITKECYDPLIETCYWVPPPYPPTTKNTTTTIIPETTLDENSESTTKKITHKTTVKRTIDNNSSTTALITTTSTTAPSRKSSPTSLCFKSTKAIGVCNNCSQFVYFNSSSDVEIYSCNPNTYFNSFEKCCMACNEIFTSGCSADSNKPSLNNLTCSKIGKKVEDANNCANYYYCTISKKIQAQTCPQGELFDWQLTTCKNAYEAETVPGCTTTRYNRCVNNADWKNFLAMIPFFKIFL